MPWCAYCRKLERFLIAKNIRYTRHDIDRNPSAKLRYRELGGTDVPFSTVGSRVIRGYNPEGILKALALTSAKPPDEEMTVPANAVPGEDRETGIDKGLYGEWSFAMEQVAGIALVASVLIEPGQVTMTTQCYLNHRKLVARASSPAKITDQEIRILETNRDKIELGDFTCSAFVTPVTIYYRLHGGRLRLFEPTTGETKELSRELPPAAH